MRTSITVVNVSEDYGFHYLRAATPGLPPQLRREIAGKIVQTSTNTAIHFAGMRVSTLILPSGRHNYPYIGISEAALRVNTVPMM